VSLLRKLFIGATVAVFAILLATNPSHESLDHVAMSKHYAKVGFIEIKRPIKTDIARFLIFSIGTIEVWTNKGDVTKLYDTTIVKYFGIFGNWFELKQ